jgi:hypothetical protein
MAFKVSLRTPWLVSFLASLFGSGGPKAYRPAPPVPTTN